jgi:recombination protein RecT
MAKKTVLKLMLSTYGPLSVEVQKAIESDQAVIKNEDGTELEYVDHEEIKVNPESERLMTLIADATSLEELEPYQDAVNALEDEDVRNAYQDRYMDLSPTE